MEKVGIIMGSESDLPVMQEAIDILEEFEIKIAVSYTHLTLPTSDLV